MSPVICKGCGAELNPPSGMASCFCEFCGTQNQVTPQTNSQSAQVEAVENLATAPAEHHKGKAAQCPGCGSQMSFNVAFQSVACNFCGHQITLSSMTEINVVDPDFIIPFATSKEEFTDTSLEYLVSGELVPNDVLEKASIGDAIGIYMPFMQFKGRYKADWSASVGMDRQEKYWERDSQGRSVQRTRTVTDWDSRNGRVNGEYALNASASKSLDNNAKRFFEELPVSDSRKFDQRIVLGFCQEVLTDNISETALFKERIKDRLDDIILDNIKGNISGDHVKDIRFTYERNRESTVSYAYPAWLVSYSYEEEPYSIYMDGRSSKNVAGNRPKDEQLEKQINIPFIVSGVVLAAAVVLWFINGAQDYSIGTFAASIVGFFYSFMNRSRRISFGLDLRKQALAAYKQNLPFDIKSAVSARTTGLKSDRNFLIYAIITALAVGNGAIYKVQKNRGSEFYLASAVSHQETIDTQPVIAQKAAEPISRPAPVKSAPLQPPHSPVVIAPSQQPVSPAKTVTSTDGNQQQTPAPAPPNSEPNKTDNADIVANPSTASSNAAPSVNQNPNTQLVIANTYKSLPIEQASPYINAMLQASSDKNETGYMEAAEAIKMLPKPSRGDRQRARQLNDQGLALLKENNWEAALSTLIHAAEFDAMDREIAGNIGFTYDKLGLWNESRFANMAALTIEPMQTSSWGGLGLALAKGDQQNSAAAAFQLAYRFSEYKDKTLKFFKNMSENDSDPRVRQAAKTAVDAISPPIQDATSQLPQGSTTATRNDSQQATSTSAVNSAEDATKVLTDKFVKSANDCLRANKFDCAISKAEAALEVDPNNAEAKRIKSKAKAEQDKAFSGDNWDAK